jgi:predicted esterase
MTVYFNLVGWSDIYGLDSSSEEDAAGFDLSASRINRIIQTEIDSGVPASKILIAGFSQGGALALHVALRSEHSLAAAVALSTWLPLNAEYPLKMTSAAGQLPVLQIHGYEDR